jgi:hypothetical protein
MIKIPLLIFAHFNEASTFIQNLKLKEEKLNKLKYFQNEQLLILICGEGFLSSIKAINSFLTIFSDKISKIYNFGIAAAIDSSLILNNIYQIRSSYGHFNQKYQFHSYELEPNKKNLTADCLSIDERVFSSKEEYKIYAKVLDRELWIIANLAKDFQLKLESYKLISDFLGSTDCQKIKENYYQYSTLLFEKFREVSQKEVKLELLETPIPNGFYATYSQKKKHESLLKTFLYKDNKKAQNQYNDLVTEVSKKDLSPKLKMSQLLVKLSALLNPIDDEISKRLNMIIPSFKNVQLKTNHSEILEKGHISINATLKDEIDKDQLIDDLKKINFNKLNDLRHGESLLSEFFDD